MAVFCGFIRSESVRNAFAVRRLAFGGGGDEGARGCGRANRGGEEEDFPHVVQIENGVWDCKVNRRRRGGGLPKPFALKER